MLGCLLLIQRQATHTVSRLSPYRYIFVIIIGFRNDLSSFAFEIIFYYLSIQNNSDIAYKNCSSTHAYYG